MFEKIVEIDIVRCLKAMWRRRVLVGVAGILGLIVGILLAVFYADIDNQYDAVASVYSISYGSYDESAQGIKAMKAYEDVVKSLQVAERAALLLGDGSLDQFAIYDMIELEDTTTSNSVYDEGANVIYIHATASTPEVAVNVVNAVANAFVLEVNTLSMNDNIQVLDEAHMAEEVYNALKMQIILCGLGMVAGILVACVVIAISVIFSDKISSVQDATLHGELEVIGAIPVINPKNEKIRKGYK
ncbi:MAG: hypothetical protein IJ326_05280 [Lachnospiraceae bacterium]|nr:hypothetical protein [Lachnospiraceae bacterium]